MIDRYSRQEMRDLWSDANKYATWLKVELAACRASELVGIVPVGTADRIETRVGNIGPLGIATIKDFEGTTRHDVAAFVQYVMVNINDEDGRWLHFGLTSSDVTDTALGLLLLNAVQQLLTGATRVKYALVDKARYYKSTPMIGRTHGMHAEPITLGLVFARWVDQLDRDIGRLDRAGVAVSVGKMSGAVGTYSCLPPAVEMHAMKLLCIDPVPIASQVVSRDRHAELLCAMAIAAATIEQIALTIRHWQRTEVAEALEPFHDTQVGSSAMPHKRNPVLCESLCGMARLMRTYAMAGLEDITLWHERDISHSSVERVVLPDATTLLDFMFCRLGDVIDGLAIDTDRMQHNLATEHGTEFSQIVLTALCKAGMIRSVAHKIVQKCAQAAMLHDESFMDLLLSDDRVVGLLGVNSVVACFNISASLAHISEIVDRAVETMTVKCAGCGGERD